MAYVATIKILVNASEEDPVYDGLNEAFYAQDENFVLDWKFDSVQACSEALNDSIANKAYAEGDAFRSWVIFARSERNGFWSNRNGWTTFEQADRFTARNVMLPHSAGMDATWLFAPNDLRFVRLQVAEGDPSVHEAGPAPTWFECWAEDFQHAVEQAKDAYPSCIVLTTEEEVFGSARKDRRALQRLPDFEPFTMYMDAYATMDDADSPRWAEVCLDEAFIKRVLRMRRVCVENGLLYVEAVDGPNRWDCEDDFRLQNQTLTVSKESFFFTARPKHSDHDVETRAAGIDTLLGTIASRSDSPSFRWMHGRLFVGPKGFAEDFFEMQSDEG